jgi:phosphomannomutase
MSREDKGSIHWVELKGESSSVVSLPPEREVRVYYSGDFFSAHGLFKWVDAFELGTAGYRDTINTEDMFSTDAPFNAHTIMFVAEAMARIYNRRGYGSIHLGGEVRRFTPEIIGLVSRVFAAHGIAVHLHADRATTPIWASSFGVFYNELDGGANVTASHSQSFKQGFKPMDEKGMQLLDMADEIKEEVRRIGKEAAGKGFTLALSPADSPLIHRDFHYLQAYEEYLRQVVPEEAFELIRRAQEAGLRHHHRSGGDDPIHAMGEEGRFSSCGGDRR